MAGKSKFIKTGKSCGCQHDGSGLSDSDEEIERKKAQKTAEETVEEAKQYSNPNVPLPLKLTGIAVILFIITR